MDKRIKDIYKNRIIKFNESVFYSDYIVPLIPETSWESYDTTESNTFLLRDNKKITYQFVDNFLGDNILSSKIKFYINTMDNLLTIHPEFPLNENHSELINYFNEFSNIFALAFSDSTEYYRCIRSHGYLKISQSSTGFSYNITLLYDSKTFKSIYITGGVMGVLGLNMKDGIVDGSLLPIVQTSLKNSYDIDINDFNDYEHLKLLNPLAEMIKI